MQHQRLAGDHSSLYRGTHVHLAIAAHIEVAVRGDDRVVAIIITVYRRPIHHQRSSHLRAIGRMSFGGLDQNGHAVRGALLPASHLRRRHAKLSGLGRQRILVGDGVGP